ncbi:cysteine desulfurase IscS [Parapedobacter defluvii]|uniref:cysteine desulfurase n=1 Tax=Parapedobacter defluvii TaxID=2045106 RepID=A0ABQ1MM47_9SPHI|nr:cysteine desulfurase family protein [Parapedobacter defluvii]GGC42967.1 cysteine desulfurase IscS [Parapedobacter defluvii]
MLNDVLYLDYAATTPTDSRVVDAMLPYFTTKFGNPASRTHDYGNEAKEAVKNAREQIADLIGAKQPEEVIFTSGATEAINLAIKGIYENYQDKGNHIITTKTEHKAVLDTCAYLEKQGAKITYLPVDQDGLINLNELEASITPETVLISVIYVNNETGVVQPIKDIAAIAAKHDVFFMTDATQALGKVPIDVNIDGIDLLTCSAHKIYGPNGVGALYVKSKFPRIKVAPQIHGGGHENGFRSGTLNTPAIVGFGQAAAIAKQVLTEESSRLAALRESIKEKLSSFPNCVFHAEKVPKAPHVISFYFKGLDAEAMIIQLREKLALSNGSACTSKEVLPSHVIMAMNHDEDIAYCTLRLSIGRFTPNDAAEKIYQAFDVALKEMANFV